MSQEFYHPLELPTKCRLYPGTNPEDIQIRTLKGKDEKLIAEISYDNFEKKFVGVIKGILKGIDPLKLTLGDRMHIVLWEVINTFGAEYPTDIICEECGKKVKDTVDLSQIVSVGLPEDFVEPFPISLESGKVIHVKLFRVADEIAVADYEKAGRPSWSYRFATTIVDDGLNIIEKEAMIDDMSSKDLAKVRLVQEKYQHGPDMLVEYRCNCGGHGIYTIPFHPRMLLPYGKESVGHFGTAVPSNVLPKDVEVGDRGNGSEGTGMDRGKNEPADKG
jgi:hypothetical protein